VGKDPIILQYTVFQDFIGKNDPHIRVLAAFPRMNGAKQVKKTGLIK
jgi:hypothetical protein